MTNGKKIARIKEFIAEVDELSKELSEEELAAVTGGHMFGPPFETAQTRWWWWRESRRIRVAKPPRSVRLWLTSRRSLSGSPLDFPI
jgi:bacteriocin-like protein